MIDMGAIFIKKGAGLSYYVGQILLYSDIHCIYVRTASSTDATRTL